MSKFVDVIFLYGQRLDELDNFCQTRLKDIYRVSSDEVFRNDPTAGIRAVTNVILQALESHCKVVLLDSCLNSTRLESYVNVLRQKVCCKVKCIVIEPKFGQNQVDIIEEFRRCRAVVNGWPYSRAAFDELRCSGVEFERVHQPPTIDLSHKLEVPVMFIQFSAVLRDNKADRRAVDAMRRWSANNKCSIIILVSLKNEDPKSVSSVAEHFDRPLYVCEGSFGDSIPSPNHGLITFLIALLNLDIHDPGSCFVYESQDFRQIAENIGLRYCNAERVWKSPDSINSLSSYTNPEPNVVLKNLVYRRIEAEPRRVLSLALKNLDNLITEYLHISDSCRLHVLVRNQECLEQDVDVYVRNATPVNEDGSRVRSFNLRHRQDTSAPVRPSGVKAKSRLPEWLLNSARSPKRPNPPRKTRLKTQYIMDDNELLQCAHDTLMLDDCDIMASGIDVKAVKEPDVTGSGLVDSMESCVDDKDSVESPSQSCSRRKAPKRKPTRLKSNDFSPLDDL